MLPSASPLCSRKTYRFSGKATHGCWWIDYDALLGRGEVCEDYKLPVPYYERSIPSAWWVTAHSYTYWRTCTADPQRVGKCTYNQETPAFPCPSAGPISPYAYPRQGTVNSAIVAGAGQEMPLNLSGSNSDLRYFSVVRTSESVNSEQPFSGMSVQGRTVTPSGELIHRAENWRTVQIDLALEGTSLIIKDPAVAHNFVLRQVGTRFIGMGGKGMIPNGAGWVEGDGIRLFTADRAAEIHSGRWLSSSSNVIIRGDHPGCVEARPKLNGICEYDGKISFVRMASAGSVVWHVFTRTNLKPHGGRFVQVASASSAQGPYGAFQPIQIDGYDEGGPGGNIYFAAVDNNPLDTETALGLFPVNLGNEEDGNGDGESFIALSLSCNGVHWSRLTKLVWSVGQSGRTWDHPVDGVVLHGDTVYALVTISVFKPSPCMRLPQRYLSNARYVAHVSERACGRCITTWRA